MQREQIDDLWATWQAVEEVSRAAAAGVAEEQRQAAPAAAAPAGSGFTAAE